MLFFGIWVKKSAEGVRVQAVILAAGLATRMKLNPQGVPKGLLRVAGRELVLRHFILLSRCGISEFVLVVNPQSRPYFERFINQYPQYRVTLVENPYPERGNGYSLWCAKEAVTGSFVLTMSDHIYEEEFVQKALEGQGIIVDREGRYIDHREATRVKLLENRAVALGKGLEPYDAFDTGFFILTSEIFSVAEKVIAQRPHGEVSLSEIIASAQLPAFDVSGYFWMDVDTPEDLHCAEKLLVKASVKGVGDGFVSRFLNRRISTSLTPYLCDYVTPNQATIFSALLGFLSAFVALLCLPLGAFLYQVHSVLDGVDGELARVTLRTSRFGGVLDSVLDRYVDFTFLAAVLWRWRPAGINMVIGLMALLGTVMVSYVTERFRGAYGRDAYAVFPELRYCPGKRDERIFLIFILGLLGCVKAMFWILAFVTHIKTFYSLWVFWKGHEKIENLE